MVCCPFSENIYSLVGNKYNNICFIVPEMSAERRYFEEEEHVALYAASRPTVPHSLLQDIIQYCNRIAQSLIYINMNFFSKLYFFPFSTAVFFTYCYTCRVKTTTFCSLQMSNCQRWANFRRRCGLRFWAGRLFRRESQML